MLWLSAVLYSLTCMCLVVVLSVCLTLYPVCRPHCVRLCSVATLIHPYYQISPHCDLRTYRSCSLPVHKVTGSAAGEQWPPLVGYESDLHTYECDFHVETWQYKDKWVCFFNNKTTSTVLVSCVCVNMCWLYWAFQCEPSSSKHSHSMGGWLFFSLFLSL